MKLKLDIFRCVFAILLHTIRIQTEPDIQLYIFSENALLISVLNIKHMPNISEIYCYAVMNYLVLNISKRTLKFSISLFIYNLLYRCNFPRFSYNMCARVFVHRVPKHVYVQYTHLCIIMCAYILYCHIICLCEDTKNTL